MDMFMDENDTHILCSICTVTHFLCRMKDEVEFICGVHGKTYKVWINKEDRCVRCSIAIDSMQNALAKEFEIPFMKESIITDVRNYIVSYCAGDIKPLRDYITDYNAMASATKISILYEAVARELFGFAPDTSHGYDRTVDVTQRVNMIIRGVPYR